MNITSQQHALRRLSIATIFLSGILFYIVYLSHDSILHKLPPTWQWHTSKSNASHDNANISAATHNVANEHPISISISGARQNFTKRLANPPRSLHDAASQYRKRRGRHPPPRFDAWYDFAVSRNALVHETFFDQITKDLAPFWGTSPAVLRQIAHDFTPRISMRGGEIKTVPHDRYPKVDVWADMLRTLAQEGAHLPDLDIPLNVKDEVALLVPWEVVDTALQLAHPILVDTKDVVNNFTSYLISTAESRDIKFDPEWLDGRLRHPASHLGPRPLWSLIRPACPPQSAARRDHVYDDIWDPEDETEAEHTAASLLPMEMPSRLWRGYVDSDASINVCEWPQGQGLHSAFVAPKEMRISTKLFPLFSDVKLGLSSEILLPGAEEWDAMKSTSSSALPTISWQDRSNRLFWRGSSDQGRDTAKNWHRFQRHRLVGMLNATHVEIAEASLHSGNESTVGVGYAGTFRLLPANDYQLVAQTNGLLAEWVNGWANVAFTKLSCLNSVGEEEDCRYLQRFFSAVNSSQTTEHDVAKYAMAIDGDNANDHGELIQNLRRGKATLRASVFRKWYDTRLMPWLHYIPVDDTFVDLYGIMVYFVGTDISDKDFSRAAGDIPHHEHHFKTPQPFDAQDDASTSLKSDKAKLTQRMIGRYTGGVDDSDAHDADAQRIAEAGSAWARKVLRRDDMLVYVYRVLLEYARLVDDRRERLGWVGDLV